jgi:membrane-associated protease RseP (regulator of RpoE activity)
MNNTFIFYYDSPALRANLSGAIIGINNIPTKKIDKFREEISKYSAGESVLIHTINGNYTVILDKNPINESGIYLGVDYITIQRRGLMGFVDKTILKFKNPIIYYNAVGNDFFSGLVVFIYNLLLWIVLINFSVALVNMMPLGMFDGGRVFYLTMLKLTGSKKAAAILYKIVTWIIIIFFVLLTVFWFMQY